MDLAQLQGLVEQPTPVGKNQLVFLCPNHRELTASAVMRDGELELSCDSGCSRKMLLMGLGITENGGRHGVQGEPATGFRPPVGPSETPPAVHTESTGAGAEGEAPASSTPGSSESTPTAVPPPPAKARQPAKQPSRKDESHPAVDLLRRVPPQNIEAEQAVLTSVMLENETYSSIDAILKEGDFYRESHRLIWRAMTQLHQAGEPIDPLTVSHMLKGHEALGIVGGDSYLVELAGAMAFPGAVASHARIVKEMAVKRNIAAAATEVASLAYNGVTADSLIGEADRLLKPHLEEKGQQVVLPKVFARETVEILSWGQLRERRQSHVQDWVVKGWLARGETSLWSGKVEHGKTTILRELILCSLRGEEFLGRPCIKSRVFFAMLDGDGENLTYDELEKIGMTDGDASRLDMMFEPNLAQHENLGSFLAFADESSVHASPEGD